MRTLILLFYLVSPNSDRVLTVDIIELNSFCNEQGNLIFDQWIFWRWSRNPQYGWRYDILDYRLAKDVRFEFTSEILKAETIKFNEEWAKIHKIIPPPKLEPEIDWSKISLDTERCVLILVDNKTGQLKNIKGKIFRHTYTNYDKEMYEREFLPGKSRKWLFSN